MFVGLKPALPEKGGPGGLYQPPQPNHKVLAAGTAPNAVATVYTVPLRTSTTITSISAHNYTGGAVTIDFYVRFNGGTAYNFWQTNIAAGGVINQNAIIPPGGIQLGAQWELRLVASAATSIDYLITGIEHFIPGGGATA